MFTLCSAHKCKLCRHAHARSTPCTPAHALPAPHSLSMPIGRSNDTTAVAATFAAAAAASAAGSNVTVVLPGPGIYVVDQPLVFNASHAELIIESDAVLRWQWDKELAFVDRWAQGGGKSATMLAFEPTPATGGPSLLANVTVSGGGMLDGYALHE